MPFLSGAKEKVLRVHSKNMYGRKFYDYTIWNKYGSNRKGSFGTCYSN